MLVLKNISVDYGQGEHTVHALRGISAVLPDTGLVTLLGPSLCGASTLLRVIAGLDKCTRGEITLDGCALKSGQEEMWRCRRVALLTPRDALLERESMLYNVELPMMLAGVSGKLRRRRALALLKKLGLGEKAARLPGQLSVYERLRLTLARCLANDPDVLLYDETGAETGEEQRERTIALLKSVAQDRLVLLATHDSLLAENGGRVISLLGGRLLADSEPMEAGEGREMKRCHRPAVGPMLALRSALRYLAARPGRSLLTVLGGALGVLALGAVLSLSGVLEDYTASAQADALSVCPITVSETELDAEHMLQALEYASGAVNHTQDGVYTASRQDALSAAMASAPAVNDIAAFLDFLQDKDSGASYYLSELRYERSEPNIYASDSSLGAVKLCGGVENPGVWAELPQSGSVLEGQYSVVAGRWPSRYDELALFLDESNQISDTALRLLGLDASISKRNYEDILSVTYRLLLPSDYYRKGADGLWARIDGDSDMLRQAVQEGRTLHVVGIFRPNEDALAHSFDGVMGYTRALGDYVAGASENSTAVQEQRNEPDYDIFTGRRFLSQEQRELDTAGKATAILDALPTMSPLTQAALYKRLTGAADTAALSGGSDALLGALQSELLAVDAERRSALYDEFVLQGGSAGTLEGNLALLGVETATVTELQLYTATFAKRDGLKALIESYNRRMASAGTPEKVVFYEDTVRSLSTAAQRSETPLRLLGFALGALALLLSSLLLSSAVSRSVPERRGELRLLWRLGASQGDLGHLSRALSLLLGLFGTGLGLGLLLLFQALSSRLIHRLWGFSAAATLPQWGWIALPAAALLLPLLCALPGSLSKKAV